MHTYTYDLIGISKASHTRKDTENIVIHGIYTDYTGDA
jgi:hypothetical protein